MPIARATRRTARARRTMIATLAVACGFALMLAPSAAGTEKASLRPSVAPHVDVADCVRSAAISGDPLQAIACDEGMPPVARQTNETVPVPLDSDGGAVSCAVDGIDDRCESWTAVYDDPEIPLDSYQFGSGFALSPDDAVVFVAASTKHGAGFDSTSQWAIFALDAASGERLWVTKWGAPEDYSFPSSIVADPRGGSVYVTGSTRTSFNDADSHLTTMALDAQSGENLWTSTYDGTAGGLDNAREAVTSPDGRHLYIGVISDSSPDNLDLDFAVVSYATDSGAEEWTARYAGPGNRWSTTDSIFSVGVDPAGARVYVTGWSAGEGDFNMDYGTVAFDATTGEQLWVARYDGVGVRAPDQAYALAVAPDGGSVFVTGLSNNVDSGPPFKVNYEIATIAYDAVSGTELWKARRDFDATNFNVGTAIAASPDSTRVFVTGQSTAEDRDVNPATIAYDAATGDEMWAVRDGLPRHNLELNNGIAVAPAGDEVYVTGISSSSDTRNLFLGQTQNGDQTTVAYDSTDGGQLWAARYNATGYDFDSGEDIMLSSDGAQLVTLTDLKHNVDLNRNFYDAGVTTYALDASAVPSPDPSATSPSPSPSQSPEETQTRFTPASARSGQFSDHALLEARVTNGDGMPLRDAQLVFELSGNDGSRQFTATSDANGVASTTVTLTERPDAYQLAVSYDGDESHASSGDTIGFVVDKEDTVVELTVEGRGNDRVVRAQLTDHDDAHAGIAGRIIDFFADARPIGSGTTDGDGDASVNPPPRYRGQNTTFEARFTGGDYYNGSTDSQEAR